MFSKELEEVIEAALADGVITEKERAVLAGALTGFFAFYVAEGAPNNMLCCIFSSACFVATLVPAIGLSYSSEQLDVNTRILSVLFLMVFMVSHFCFAGWGVKMPYYLIVNGLLLLIYLALIYKTQDMKNV